jgi:hypothetical protein
MGKLHKRTHLGVRRVSKRTEKRGTEVEDKRITARPPSEAATFITKVEDATGGHLARAPGCFRTFTPPEEE